MYDLRQVRHTRQRDPEDPLTASRHRHEPGSITQGRRGRRPPVPLFELVPASLVARFRARTKYGERRTHAWS
jgi:hypothetical protein